MELANPQLLYLWIIIPQLRPILLAAILLLTFNVIRSFDLIVALTSGGPGFSSDVPAKYIYDYFFARSNIARGAAAAPPPPLRAVRRRLARERAPRRRRVRRPRLRGALRAAEDGAARGRRRGARALAGGGVLEYVPC